MCDMQPVAQATGDRIRVARLAAGHSQQSLASTAGLSIRTVARIEQGEDTKIGTLAAIADVLGMPLSELVAEQAS